MGEKKPTIAEIPNAFTRTQAKRVAERLKEVGGKIIDGACRPRELAPPKGVKQPSYTCGCGGMTRMALPYNDHTGRARFATICAVCDGASHMPRLS